MQYQLCRHVKTNGLQCKAAALAGGLWCYFHHPLHQRHTAFRPTPSPPANSTSSEPPPPTGDFGISVGL